MVTWKLENEYCGELTISLCLSGMGNGFIGWPAHSIAFFFGFFSIFWFLHFKSVAVFCCELN